jgi:hypothetical protein
MQEFQWYLTIVPRDNSSPVANPQSGNTLYYLEGDQIRGKSHGSINDADLRMVMRHFGTYKDSDFVRMQFASRHTSPSAAMDLFLVTLRNGGTYNPPPYSDVLYRVTLGLANFCEPNYSDIDKDTIAAAFAMVWEDPQWLEQLKADIKVLSLGYVTLTIDDTRWMPTRGLGPGKYLHLILGDQTKIVCIGPHGVSMKQG